MATLAGYMINEQVVTAPTSESWTDDVVGTALDLTQKRSPYKTLVWRREVSGPRQLDWFDYDNTILDSLVTREPGELRSWVRYTDAVCVRVAMQQSQQRGLQVEATFLVNTES